MIRELYQALQERAARQARVVQAAQALLPELAALLSSAA
jgi:hypothetical protein